MKLRVVFICAGDGPLWHEQAQLVEIPMIVEPNAAAIPEGSTHFASERLIVPRVLRVMVTVEPS